MERIPIINLGRLEITRRPMTPSEAAAAFLAACASADVLPRPELDLPHDWADPESKW